MANVQAGFLYDWIEKAKERLGLHSRRVVESVYDGDTLRFVPPIGEGVSVRFLNIDAPELGGDTQEPWARDARDYLRELVPIGSLVTIQTPPEQFDVYGRVLGHVFRKKDKLHVNLELVRMGHVSTYFIWPNVTYFAAFRRAQMEAQKAGRGIWNAEQPLEEMAFEYRLRKQKRVPDKFVGDWLTKLYYAPNEYKKVDIHNRLFFLNEADAKIAGYTKWDCAEAEPQWT